MDRYKFFQLDEAGDPVVRATVTVDDDKVTWEPPEEQERIEPFLTGTPFFDEETDDFAPFDLTSEEGWERIPRVLGAGSYFWCTQDHGGDVLADDEEELGKADFKEGEHPRDDDGKFSDKGGGGGSSAPAAKTYSKKPVPASEKSKSHKVPMRDGKPVPIKTKKCWHVTKRENLDSLLSNGFDLNRTKPNWQNDYAISFDGQSLKSAMKYFTSPGKDAKYDSKKYAVVEATVTGRFFDYHKDDMYNAGRGAKTPQDYTKERVEEGWDAGSAGAFYVYNPDAIGSIREVSKEEITAASAKKR